jgi:dGTP triphosphohydrolase
MSHPEELPSPDPGADPLQRVTDYLAGMTDRYCLTTYENLAASGELGS